MLAAAAAGKCASQPPIPATREPPAKALAPDLDESLYESNLDDHKHDGWAMACPPNSALRSAAPFEERQNTWVEPRPSFIVDHPAAMDLCAHPDRQMMHGFTAWCALVDPA